MPALQGFAPRMRPGLILLFAAAFPLLACSALAQNSNSGPSVSTGGSGFADIGAMDQAHLRMARFMVGERNQQRQKAIVDDTAHLLDLAQQLKAAVDKSDKDQLSLKVIDTAAEIEKLAKTVREKMRNPD